MCILFYTTSVGGATSLAFAVNIIAVNLWGRSLESEEGNNTCNWENTKEP